MSEDFDEELAEWAVPERGDIKKAPVRDHFSPWHKPRKQAVRRSWVYNIKRLMGRLREPYSAQKPVFRYLTLAAPEMLDIRMLRPVCQERNYKLKFVNVFSGRPEANEFSRQDELSRDQAMLDLAQNKIRSETDWVEETSTTVSYRLEEVAAGEKRSSSVAFQTLSEHGPYHAINLDLCAHLADPRANPSGFDALGRLLEIQAGCQHEWLLFIATRVDPGRVSLQCLEAFARRIRENAADSEQFAAALNELLEGRDVDSVLVQDVPADVTRDAFRKAFCLGMGKWLVHHLAAYVPPYEVHVLNGYFYTVDAPGDMVSLLFRCAPKSAHALDSTGALRVQGQPAPALDLERLGLMAMRRTQDLRNIDECNEELDALIEEMAELLQEAGYDAGRYREWVWEHG